MRDVEIKLDDAGYLHTADEINVVNYELENAVTSAGITLDTTTDTDLYMLAKAIAAYSSASNTYSDSGVANAYVLSKSTALKSVDQYYDGMVILFDPGNTNTGASTVDLNSIGAKSITLPDGTALSAGDLLAGYQAKCVYDSTGAGTFKLQNPARLDRKGVVLQAGVDSGAADAYVVLVDSKITKIDKYYDGMIVIFKPTNANTGASTINMNSIGVKSITTPDGLALTSGNLTTAMYAQVAYNLSSDRFELINKDNPNLIAEAEVTGSAVTSIDFTGLDINTHKSYRMEIEFKNALASVVGAYLFVNNDTTVTNYASQRVTSNGATVASEGSNTPTIFKVSSNEIGVASALVTAPVGIASVMTNISSGSIVGAMVVEQTSMVKLATVANITQLTLTSSTALGFAVGTKVRIFKAG